MSVQERTADPRHSLTRRAAAGRRRRGQSFRASVENLEGRQLLAAAVTAFPVPTPGAFPVGVLAAAVTAYLYPQPPAPSYLVFTEAHAGKIGLIDGQGKIQEVSLPPGVTGSSGVARVVGSGVAFTEPGAHEIGMVTVASPLLQPPQSGGGAPQITEFTLPTRNAVPGVMTSDGTNAWFSETVVNPNSPAARPVNKIGEFMPGGAILEFPLPAGTEADALTFGPDGNVWFVDRPNNAVGKMTPSGVVTEFKLATAANGPFNQYAGLYGIATGLDGNLWFTEAAAHRIGKVTPSGKVTVYPLPTLGATPTGITAGPDGDLWFTETTFAGPRVGRISPLDGRVTELPLPPGFVNPIAIAPDGNNALAFADPGANRIGRISTDPHAGFEIFQATSYPQPIVEFQGLPDPNIRVATFQTNLPSATPSTYIATIDWGDGTAPSVGKVLPNPFSPFATTGQGVTPAVFIISPPGTFGVSGAHTYAHGGTYSVHVKVTDSFGFSTSATDTAIVSADPYALVPGTYGLSGTVGKTTGYGVARIDLPGSIASDAKFTATIQWGDGTSSVGAVDPIFSVFPADARSVVPVPPFLVGTPPPPSSPPPNVYQTFVVDGNHTYSRAGDFPVTVTVADAQGHSQTVMTTIHITADVAVATPKVYVNTPNLISSHRESNVDVATIQTNRPDDRPSDYAATIDWGDGTTSAGAVKSSGFAAGFFNVEGDHTYAHGGVFPTRVTVFRAGFAPQTVTGFANVSDPSQFVVSDLVIHVQTGHAFTGELPSFYTLRPHAKPSDYAALVDWGDGTPATRGVVKVSTFESGYGYPTNLVYFAVTGPHTYAHPGSYTARVTVRQYDGKVSQSLVDFEVTDAPPPPYYYYD